MTGKYSIYTLYEGHEIMFHVSTLLPFSRDNRQQVCNLIFVIFFFLLFSSSQKHNQPNNIENENDNDFYLLNDFLLFCIVCILRV